jgi:ferredoxin
MHELAVAQGFVPFAGAALIGQHTYGEIQVGRPNSTDLSEDKAFARRAYKKLIESGAGLVSVPGSKPYRDGGNGGGFRPLTNDNCIECGLCAANCPEGAIDGDDFKSIDNEKCIACFRCIRECPVDAKNMDDKTYNDFAAGFTKKLAARRENEFFV